MMSQRVSLSFLSLYERDSSAINHLCRTCLCKTDDEYISIRQTMPWSQRESCPAQKIIEQILNKEVHLIKIHSFSMFNSKIRFLL